MALLWHLMRRQMRAQKRRTYLTIAAVTMAAMLLTVVTTLVWSFLVWMDDGLVREYGDYHAMIDYQGAIIKADWPKQSAMLQSLKKQAGITVGIYGDNGTLDFGAVPEDVLARYPEENRLFVPKRCTIDLTAYDQSALKLTTFKVAQGRLPEQPGEIALYAPLPEWAPRLDDTFTCSLGRLIRLEQEYVEGEVWRQLAWEDEYILPIEKTVTLKVVGILEDSSKYTEPLKGYGMVMLEPSQQISEPGIRIGIRVDNGRDIDAAVRRALDNCDGKLDGKYMNGTAEIAGDYSAHGYTSTSSWDEQGNQITNAPAVSFLYPRMLTHMQLPPWETLTDFYGDIRIIMLIILVPLAVVIGASVIVIFNAFNISVMERAGEIGLLRALGATPLQIRRHVMMQSLYVSAAAVPVGMALGLGGVCAWGALARRIVTEESAMDIHILPPLLILTALLSVGTVIIASLIPARSAARISPVDAMRGSFHVKQEKPKARRQWLPTGGVTGLLARKNINRMPARFRVTVLSLTLSMVLLMLTVYVGSIAVSQLLSPDSHDISLYAQEGADAMSREFIEKVRAIPGVMGVTENYMRGVVVDMRKDAYTEQFWQNAGDSGIWWNTPSAELVGSDRATLRMSARIETYDEIDLRNSRQYVIDGAFDEAEMVLERSVGVLAYGMMETKVGTRKYRGENGAPYEDPVYEYRLTRINTLAPGDTLRLYDMDNSREYRMMTGYSPIGGNIKPVSTVTVKAVVDRAPVSGGSVWLYEDCAYLYMPSALFRELFPDARPYSLSVYTDPEQHGGAMKALATMQLSDASFTMSDMQAENRRSFAETLIYFGAMALFMLVLVMISFTSILNTMAAGVLSRKREFAMMIACGMSGEQLTQVVRKEGKLYAVYAAVAGVLLTGAVCGGSILYDHANTRFFANGGLPSLITAPILAALVLMLMTRAATRMPLKKLRDMDLVQAMSTDE